jgi:hypothetical protein
MVLTAAKATVYGRPLTRGAEFNVPDKEAKVWTALSKAKNLTGSEVAPGAPSDGDGDEIAALRADFKTAIGRDPDMRWGVGRLKNELQRGGSYIRRDMRAED